MDHKVHHPVAVAKFIAISGNKFYKVVIDSNISPYIKGRRVGVIVKVAGDNLSSQCSPGCPSGKLTMFASLHS